MKIKTLTLMRKRTTWEINDVSGTMTLEIRVIILGIQVETMKRWPV